ncbi:dihydrolipoyl dehydrogenase [Blochmannia endosymbiont of Camponotus (Colobopsis) obliquus]|nr:dihydrolipoyl dehydrogenase [Blochmannia endosymbiont of Camponotus (Colobopsis) obliquus]
MIRKIRTKVVVLGAGPGGYSAAFRCSDLGMDTVIVEERLNLGGVCLNVGCIPSKTLLHFVKIIQEMKLFNNRGIVSNSFQIDLNGLRSWKEGVIKKLADGLNNMARMRKIEVIHGCGKFVNSNLLQVEGKSEICEIYFDYAVIATGSRDAKLSFKLCDDARIWNSTDALELKMIPDRLLIVGGGAIGLEMATIFQVLGSRIDLVEMSDRLVPAVDIDIVKIFTKYMNNKFNLMFSTKVKKIQLEENAIFVTLEQHNKSLSNVKLYDAILIAIGRIPNSKFLDVGLAGVQLDSQGFVLVDKQMRTSVSHIFAIGDVVGQSMLAHKSIHEGHVAAEVIAGKHRYFDPKVIPYVIYTDPELSWVGLTERVAKTKNISCESSIFPWLASGRAVASNCQQGLTKLVFNKDTHKIIGGTVLGVNASELLGEIGLAIEMGCYAEDISMTVHAHPTLYESIGSAASIYDGSVTDMINMKVRMNNR